MPARGAPDADRWAAVAVIRDRPSSSARIRRKKWYNQATFKD